MIGIDYSINSTAVTLNQDSDLHFLSYFRPGQLTKREQTSIDILQSTNNVQIKFFDKLIESKNYTEMERLCISDASNFNNIILSDIKNITDDSNVAIEGFSYNSKGSSASKLYGYQYIMRYILYQNNYKLDIFSPNTIKKTAGKGNYSKCEMIETFLNQDIELELKTNILNNLNIFQFNKKWTKPFEDIVDSYWVYMTLKLFLKKLK